MSMKKIILTSLIFAICCAAQAKTYFNDTVPPNAGMLQPAAERTGNYYHLWNNDTQSYTTYERHGNTVSGSDGSSYTINGNQLQNTFTGDRYQNTGGIWEPIY